jgi:DNA adenine methylase
LFSHRSFETLFLPFSLSKFLGPLYPNQRCALPSVKPFLKWAGGKQQLLAQYEQYFPAQFQRYFEPFVGGGAVFFHLWNAARLGDNTTLFDTNAELINVYTIVRDRVEDLIDVLALHEHRHSREYYYKIRGLDRQPGHLSDLELAARTIYLNRTCYNGLYRVNKRGHFNVPMGSYKDPKVLHVDTLRAASIALQGVWIERRSFETVRALGERNDFFYFDPPYDPVSRTASFTSYTAGNFRDEEQRRLAKVYAHLSNKGCLCMLSNSYTPFVLELYQNYRIEIVQANRAINSNGNSRGNVKEVVVLNY